MPTAPLRRSFGKALRTMARVFGISMAPNTPWIARKAITPPTDPTSPTPIEPRPKPATPIKNSSR